MRYIYIYTTMYQLALQLETSNLASSKIWMIFSFEYHFSLVISLLTSKNIQSQVVLVLLNPQTLTSDLDPSLLNKARSTSE